MHDDEFKAWQYWWDNEMDKDDSIDDESDLSCASFYAGIEFAIKKGQSLLDEIIDEE